MPPIQSTLPIAIQPLHPLRSYSTRPTWAPTRLAHPAPSHIHPVHHYIPFHPPDPTLPYSTQPHHQYHTSTCTLLALHHLILPHTTAPHPVPHHTTPHHTTPHHTTPPHTTSHHPIPPHTTPYHLMQRLTHLIPPHSTLRPPHTTSHHATTYHFHTTPYHFHTTPRHRTPPHPTPPLPTVPHATPHHTTPHHTAPHQDTKGGSSTTDARSLSGGERSFTTLAFEVRARVIARAFS